ncbi:COG0730 Predicted permeases [Burkholderiaceae bacterium]
MSFAIVVSLDLGQTIAKVDFLTTAIGAAVLITAVGLLFTPKLLANARNLRVSKSDQFKKLQPSLNITTRATLGLCVALTSVVGTGALSRVFLLYLYPSRLTQHRLVTTDIVYATPLACGTRLGYLFAGLVDGEMLLSLLVGSVPTVIFGSLISERISGSGIQIALTVVLFDAGLKVLIQVCRVQYVTQTERQICRQNSSGEILFLPCLRLAQYLFYFLVTKFALH